jgi:hypothetical protein
LSRVFPADFRRRAKTRLFVGKRPATGRRTTSPYKGSRSLKGSLPRQKDAAPRPRRAEDPGRGLAYTIVDGRAVDGRAVDNEASGRLDRRASHGETRNSSGAGRELFPGPSIAPVKALIIPANTFA